MQKYLMQYGYVPGEAYNLQSTQATNTQSHGTAAPVEADPFSNPHQANFKTPARAYETPGSLHSEKPPLNFDATPAAHGETFGANMTPTPNFYKDFSGTDERSRGTGLGDDKDSEPVVFRFSRDDEPPSPTLESFGISKYGLGLIRG
ncbi:hypothetical protein HDU96_003054 [Phlyctochytrium bullatum]|nr:hypothetical protein HDU96_003054 [Phlyctochytrium bullatum]